jgi:hypothetical protein
VISVVFADNFLGLFQSNGYIMGTGLGGAMR